MFSSYGFPTMAFGDGDADKNGKIKTVEFDCFCEEVAGQVSCIDTRVESYRVANYNEATFLEASETAATNDHFKEYASLYESC